MKKSVIIFMIMIFLSVGMIAYGCIFLDHQIGEAVLTEETAEGSRGAAVGLEVGFRADSADDFHWINSYNYSTNRTASSFKRGKMAKTDDTFVYDDIRFTGWSVVPYYTQLKYERLEGLQEKKIHAFYNEIQQRVKKSSLIEEGKIRLKDYLDYYPVSFRFQFGNKIYNSDNALSGLKVYDERNMLSAENGASYDADVNLYKAFNDLFKIPVIDNEYQQYKVSGVENYDYETSLGYRTNIMKPFGSGEDYYEFDPILVVQEENTMDGMRWYHPEPTENLSGNNLKNRMLFIVNNRTAKGASVDVSQISGGYGVYELPIEVAASATVTKGRRSWTVPDPKPLTEQLAMAYPLDENAEYVEMSLSGDHRYLSVFSVKDGAYFMEMIDADTWTSQSPIEVFPASEKMTYAWGEDGSLAVTNHEGYIAVLCRTENEKEPYEILYKGKVTNDLDRAFFDTEMVSKENSYAEYKYGIDTGLAVAATGGKVALVHNLPAGDFNIRNAALECAVLDKTGVLYIGQLRSNLVDLEYDMSEIELQEIIELTDGCANGEEDSWLEKLIIKPVRNENWSTWKTPSD
ncbi:MAG: hypothetical protein Q4C46_10495 [Bacillota bacterium]|nr:hypothetical protein [Bacillota bacterium]